MAGLGFACCLLAGFSLVCFLQVNLLSTALYLRAFLSLSLSFRCGRNAALGLLLSLFLPLLSQIAVDPQFFQPAPLLLDAFPLRCRAPSRVSR
jgi:hypothetical protein